MQSDHILVVGKVQLKLKVRKRRPQLGKRRVIQDGRLPQEHVKEFKKVLKRWKS